jgi:hypothetical protein
VKLLVGYAVLTYIARSGSADPGEWDNLVPTELAELADIPTHMTRKSTNFTLMLHFLQVLQLSHIFIVARASS